MVDNKDKNGTSDDFEDDFDVEDFSESDFDEAAFDDSEIADLPDEDFGDEDFADNEWQEDNAANKRLLTSGEKKGLSFNTMVMIGAFVVGGGVLALNVLSKSKEQSAENSGGVFQSMLDISGVMDGDLFGKKESEQTPEQLAAQAEQTKNEGFLNNPDAVIPSDTLSNPPQPMPIAPPDEAATDNDPLTPMPEAAMPRGPEDGAPESRVAISETPIEQPAPSAEDILKKAMANREQKAAGSNEEDIEPVFPIQAPLEEEPEIAEDVVPVKKDEPAPVARVDEPAPQKDLPAVVAGAVPVADVPPAAATPAASPEAVAQNTEALEALDDRLQDVLKRMDQIETDLGSVKNGKQADTDGLQETIETLKAEIAELKRRPATAPASTSKAAKPAVEEREEPAVDEIMEEPAPKKAAPKKVAKAKPAPTQKAASASTVSSSGRWELRAAQPGRAWVSKPGERDMQSVEVGQTISAIGRVTAILYQNGRWTVQGTQGQINQ